MKIKVILHEADEGGFWAEVPVLPGCASQGDTLDELMQHIREAISGYLEAEVTPAASEGRDRVVELAF